MSHTGGEILTFNKAILEIILGINWYHQRVKWSKLHWIPKNGILTMKKNYGGRNTSSRKTVNFRKKWTVFCQWSKFDLNLGVVYGISSGILSSFVYALQEQYNAKAIVLNNAAAAHAVLSNFEKARKQLQTITELIPSDLISQKAMAY